MIDGTEVGDTAVYYPENHTVFHYKRSSYFMFDGMSNEGSIAQYTTGIKRFLSAEGTWRDAEDGALAGNPIAQGSVDSTIAVHARVGPRSETVVYYWMSAGHCLEDVLQLNRYVREGHPEKLMSRIVVYWRHWLRRADGDFADLPQSVVRMFRQSLLIIRTQIDERGAILAANDTDILQFSRDHYSYVWPRDGALVALAMSLAGYHSTVAPFFHFCADALSPQGFLYHKYNPDGTVGSSWHPYFADGAPRLPIQEDETALVLYALRRDYDRHGEIELPQSLYGKLIRKAAAFLCEHLEPSLSLPKPSYDLWEERFGIWTFTAATVYGGLQAAAFFSDLFGDYERSEQLHRTAEQIKNGILAHLWNEELGRFARGLVFHDGRWMQDTTLESSLFGLFAFGVLPADDERVVRTMEAVREGLTVKTDVGGVARYTGDYYFRRSDDIERIPGNPWIICTLWTALFDIERARVLAELERPKQTLEWVVRRALPTGVLPEQVHPLDGSPLSVAPLTWSHATFVEAVHRYIQKYDSLRLSAG